jgi:hypothetical protein
MVLPEAEIDDNDDPSNDPGGPRTKDSPMDNDRCDIPTIITGEDRLDVATQNRLMLEQLLENHTQWNAEYRP